MKILVACEYSGVVRRAFRNLGHDAWSCDILQSEDSSKYHIQDDALKVLAFGKWDMLIAFPPCTHLSVSGARWWKEKEKEQKQAIEFAAKFIYADVPKVAVENPIGVLSTALQKPEQIIQPWQFGHGETKATCLWLWGLPTLLPTNIVAGREARVHRMAPGPNRWRERSRTYSGIAKAMADQWGW